MEIMRLKRGKGIPTESQKKAGKAKDEEIESLKKELSSKNENIRKLSQKIVSIKKNYENEISQIGVGEGGDGEEIKKVKEELAAKHKKVLKLTQQMVALRLKHKLAIARLQKGSAKGKPEDRAAREAQKKEIELLKKELTEKRQNLQRVSQRMVGMKTSYEKRIEELEGGGGAPAGAIATLSSSGGSGELGNLRREVAGKKQKILEMTKQMMAVKSSTLSSLFLFAFARATAIYNIAKIKA